MDLLVDAQVIIEFRNVDEFIELIVLFLTGIISFNRKNYIHENLKNSYKIMILFFKHNIYKITGGDLRKMITQLQYNSISSFKFLPTLLENYKNPEIILQKLLKENIYPDYLLIEIYNYALENNHYELLLQLSNIDGCIQNGGQPIVQLMTVLQYL